MIEPVCAITYFTKYDISSLFFHAIALHEQLVAHDDGAGLDSSPGLGLNGDEGTAWASARAIRRISGGWGLQKGG